MFKNANIFRIVSLPEDFSEGMTEPCFQMFEPCGPTQEKSVGWVSPRGIEHGPLVELVAGQWILKLMTETKTVPASSIKSRIDLWKKEIERQTGRKPGKKETREQQEDIRLALLPHAFAKQSATLVWIDPKQNLLVVDASSQSKADEAIASLVTCFQDFGVQYIQPEKSPAAAMADWLVSKDAPAGFSVDRECELKATDESKSVVKYSRHSLDSDEVSQHILGGKRPVKLALTHNDRTSFVLTEGLQIKKIAFLDAVNQERSANEADAFDADVFITTSELTSLIDALIEALGGEAQ